MSPDDAGAGAGQPYSNRDRLWKEEVKRLIFDSRLTEWDERELRIDKCHELLEGHLDEMRLWLAPIPTKGQQLAALRALLDVIHSNLEAMATSELSLAAELNGMLLLTTVCCFDEGSLRDELLKAILKMGKGAA